MRIPTRITQMSAFPRDLTGPPSLAAVSLQGAPRVSSIPLTHLSQVCVGSCVSHPTFLLFFSEVCVWRGRRIYVYYSVLEDKKTWMYHKQQENKTEGAKSSSPAPLLPPQQPHHEKCTGHTFSPHKLREAGTMSLAQHRPSKPASSRALPSKHRGRSSK